MSTRTGVAEYTKRQKDLVTMEEAAEIARRLVNHAMNRYIAEHVEPMRARIEALERPWYRRLWSRG